MQTTQFNTINTSELPRNLFVDYFNELHLNWAVDLNEADILASYQNFVAIHNKLQSKGIQPSFDLAEKEKAKDYLLNVL